MPTTIQGTTGVNLTDTNSVATASVQNASITPAKLSQPLTLGTERATTSGTAIDFTAIPSWLKRITVLFNGVSTNGTSNGLIQLGSGFILTSGYFGSSSSNAAYNVFTNGFGIRALDAAGALIYGSFVISKISESLWVCSGVVGRHDTAGVGVTGGVCNLGGTLDRIRLTTVNGTDTFDAGSVNIMYE